MPRLSNAQRVPLDSRAVATACYDASTQTLELEFATGRVYQFFGVPDSVYAWLLRTPRKGAYVSRMINGRYPHRDVTPAPATAPGLDLEAMLRASIAERDPKD